jgi:hypothetical protein
VCDDTTIRVKVDPYEMVREMVHDALSYVFDRKAYKHKASPLSEQQRDRLLEDLEDTVMDVFSEGLHFPDPNDSED